MKGLRIESNIPLILITLTIIVVIVIGYLALRTLSNRIDTLEIQFNSINKKESSEKSNRYLSNTEELDHMDDEKNEEEEEGGGSKSGAIQKQMYQKAKKHLEKIKARALMSKIIEAQIETGQPYMLYKDSINEKSNQKNRKYKTIFFFAK